MKTRDIILLLFAVFQGSCTQHKKQTDITDIGTTSCLSQPYYLTQTGLNRHAAVLSTSEKKIKGLVLVEYNQDNGRVSIGKTWQHPTWSKYGWLGPIATDEKGNTYAAPVPVINVLDNPIEEQNTVLKVNGQTAEMKPLVALPLPDSITHDNPYGILGIYYDCDARLLFASSVAGSDRKHERGVIYIINPENGSIEDKLEGIDAMGLCTGGVTGERRLYIGSSRQPFIYSIGLKGNGKFSGEPRKEISLDMMGPRGDDKARRIRFDNTGTLQVFGIEFNYNLTAATEKQESVYYFAYDPTGKQWTPVNKQ
jgi:hypothetical protein